MTLDDLIVSAQPEGFREGDVGTVAALLQTTPGDLLEQLARRLAEGYVRGEYTFEIGDAVMDAVFNYAMQSGVELSRFAWGVFEAFDQGAFRGEETTKCLLAVVLDRGYLARGDCM